MTIVQSVDRPGPPPWEPALRAIAMPADTNPNGDIFGGWLLSQMDLAGGYAAGQRVRGRVATIAIEAMKFHRPVVVGDEVSCYASITKLGRTSITILVEAWARPLHGDQRTKVTEGVFTFVAIDDQRRPRQIDQSQPG
ncbi:MAG TPA: acyl-CoA thioesterase [Stellaceae bacterium]|nr:acyl-CoA thioesterase [Stellaceae bacterium]